jgi:hypothetical protein
MLALSSKHFLTNTAKCIYSRPHIDRCKNLPIELSENKISFYLMFSSLNRTEIGRLGQAAFAEVHRNRSSSQLQYVASMKQKKQNCLVDACCAAGKLTRPTKSSRLRITFTKTSPQQTDPPAR